MTPPNDDNSIQIGSSHTPTPGTQSAARARQKAPLAVGQYLEDHPILIPIVTLVLGGFCLYLSVFTHTLRDMMFDPHTSSETLNLVDNSLAWIAAPVAALMLISIIFLGMHGLGRGFYRFVRKRHICPRCRAVEDRKTLFPHTTVSGTGWYSVHCPKCAHEWYVKS